MRAAALLASWSQRPWREKALVLGVVTLAALAAADALLSSPLEKKIRRSQAALQTANDQLVSLTPVDAAGGAAPQDLRGQERRLRERLQAAQRQAQDINRRVAEAARLPETLRAITATVGATRLLELDLAADAEAVSAATTGAGRSASNEAGQGGVRRLHRLPITLKVSGSYAELHLLLTQIERHAQALHWSAVTLDNSEWPAISMTLKAHVLSHEPRWGAAS